MFEGGIRVNAFLSGGFLPASVRGTKLEGMIHIVDWYATFCALAGIGRPGACHYKCVIIYGESL